MAWSSEDQAYKFFLKNENPQMIEEGIQCLKRKAEISAAVSKIFATIHLSSEFQAKPMEYMAELIQNLTQIKPEISEKERAKVIKRLESIQDSGSFSAAGEFYIKI